MKSKFTHAKMSGKNKNNNKKQNKNQPSIKDTLLARKKQQKEVGQSYLDLSIDIDPPLLEYNDILNTNNYEVSKMARVHFRAKSNINDVLDRFIEYKKYQNYSKGTFLDSMIRCVMSEKHRVFYPYNTFKFNSQHDEIIGKVLLMHPAIESTEDLDKVHEFYTKNRLKHCSVKMDFNNAFHSDIKNAIEAKKERYGPERLHHYQKLSFNTVLRKYYESKGMVEYIDLQTITLEEICAISNFEERAIKVANIDKEDFETYGDALLEVYKQSPEARFKDKKLFINPRYYLLCNYISPDREASIITDMKTFYKKTNAYEILRQYKEEFSRNLDPSLTKEQITQKARERFFMQYLRQPQRNMPPFHDLYIVEDEDDDDEDTFNAEITPQPADIRAPETPSKITYRRRQVCAKNSDNHEVVNNVATSSGSSSNEPTVIENENAKMPNIEMNAEDFQQTPDPSNSEMQLVVILARSPNVLLTAREGIKDQFPNEFAALWNEDSKRITFVHYVLHFLRKKSQPFRGLIEKSLADETKDDALKLFDELVAYNQGEFYFNLSNFF